MRRKIRSMLGQHNRPVELTKNQILNKLLDIAEKATRAKQYAVARNCVRDLGQELYQMFAERSEHTEYVAIAQLLTSGDLSQLSDEHLERLLELVKKLGGTNQKAISANETGPLVTSQVVDVTPEKAAAPEAQEPEQPW